MATVFFAYSKSINTWLITCLGNLPKTVFSLIPGIAFWRKITVILHSSTIRHRHFTLSRHKKNNNICLLLNYCFGFKIAVIFVKFRVDFIKYFFGFVFLSINGIDKRNWC